MKKKVKVLLFLGPPGVGKTTQGKRLSEKHAWLYVCAGELIEANEAPARPGLAFDAPGTGIQSTRDSIAVARRMEELARLGVELAVLDGFPRLSSEVGPLLAESEPVAAFYLTGPCDDTLFHRFAAQGPNRLGGVEPDPEDFAAHLDAFREGTAPVVLEATTIPLLPIDARGAPDEVASRIEAALRAIDLD